MKFRAHKILCAGSPGLPRIMRGQPVSKLPKPDGLLPLFIALLYAILLILIYRATNMINFVI